MAAPSSPLTEVLRHNTWATLRLIDFCKTIDASLLDRGAPGTYGSIIDTLNHIVRSEQFYLLALTGQLEGAALLRTEPRPLDELRDRAKTLGERGQRVAADEDGGRHIQMPSGKRCTVGVIFAQLVHHGNEHRAQVKTVLGTNGIEPPTFSGWAYGHESGLSQEQDY